MPTLRPNLKRVASFLPAARAQNLRSQPLDFQISDRTKKTKSESSVRGPGPSARRQKLRASRLVIAGAGLIATSCTSPTNEKSANTDLVLVTMDIWSDVVGNLDCQQTLKIETLIPPGADPHGFEASLRDRTDLGQARLVVANGLSLEEGLLDTIDSAQRDGTPVVKLGDEIESFIGHRASSLDAGSAQGTSDTETKADHDDSDHDDPDHDDSDHDDSDHDESAHQDSDQRVDAGGSHNHNGLDPHIWFDPTLVAEALPILRDRLVTDAGLDDSSSQRCLAAYLDELESLDAEIMRMFEQVPATQRILVTNHGSLGYFADRYDLEVIGTVIPSSSSLAEVNPASLERLAETIRRMQVPAIFTEAGQSNSTAQALGERLGVPVIPLATSSLGPEESESATYVEWLRTTAAQIMQGLTS